MPAAHCSACVAGPPWSAHSGNRRSCFRCRYIMRSSIDREMASLLGKYQDAVQRLAEVPGLGVDSAQQIIAEVGPTAATFPSAKCLSSWVGACPGDDETAG